MLGEVVSLLRFTKIDASGGTSRLNLNSGGIVLALPYSSSVSAVRVRNCTEQLSASYQ